MSVTELPTGCVTSPFQSSRINSDKRCARCVHNPRVSGLREAWQPRINAVPSPGRPLTGSRAVLQSSSERTGALRFPLCVPLLLIPIFRLRGKNETLTHNLRGGGGSIARTQQTNFSPTVYVYA